ncbi:MAG: alpha/beta hydrolase [Myxococcota bacterium]
MSWARRFDRLGARRVDEVALLNTRAGLEWFETRSGRVRVRRSPSNTGPRLLLATDAPNVLEHYDDLLSCLRGRADVVIFEPPGTGGSIPTSDFDYSLDAFVGATADVLERVAPRTLVFPCYTGYVGLELARAKPSSVETVVTPQTPEWAGMLAWLERVDPQRFLRTPILGQLLNRARRADIIQGWYRASAADRALATQFRTCAHEPLSHGGNFCLASMMQGFGRGVSDISTHVSQRRCVPYGPKDRTHRAEHFAASDVIRFEGCGHAPEIEAPEQFTDWLITWLAS